MHTVTADIAHPSRNAARMVAIEILLSDPEALGDDVLEAALYIYREKLRASPACHLNDECDFPA